MGKVVLPVCRSAEGGQHSGNESQGKDLVDVKGSEDERSSERQNVSGATVRQALWEAHLQSPMSSLEQSLKRTEAGAGRVVSSTAGGSET